MDRIYFRKSRKARQVALALVRALAALTLAACAPAKVEPQEVPGTYEYRTGYGLETLVLTGDGRFTERFEYSSGRVLTAAGRWTYRVEGGRSYVFVEQAIVDPWSELHPARPERLDYLFQAYKRGGKVTLDPGDPDGVLLLTKVD